MLKKRKVLSLSKINLKDKKQAAEIFDALGLNLATAINIFIKKSIAGDGLPFEVKNPFYSEGNQAELNRRFKKVTNNQTLHSHYLLDNEKH